MGFKRYSDQEKEEILAFIKQYDEAHKRGGPAQARKRFGVTFQTLQGWLGRKKAPKGETGVKPAKERERAPVMSDSGRTPDPGPKVGVYVDVSNVNMNGGYGMQYDVLVDFACRGGGVPLRFNAYLNRNPLRAETDPEYDGKQEAFYAKLRSFGYKVLVRDMKFYYDENGVKHGKANSDVDMCVDMLLNADKLDKAVLVTGDGDFVNAVKALQNRGCRVEVVGFDNVSSDLKKEADYYLPGYMIPCLLPTEGGKLDLWGEVGSRVRGVCHTYRNLDGYGFMKYMGSLSPDFWKNDTRREGSPFKDAYFHHSDMPSSVNLNELPAGNLIFEFELARNPRKEGTMAAKFIRLISPKRK